MRGLNFVSFVSEENFMKKCKSKPELLVLTHGKNHNLQFFDPICICPECFSDKLMALDKGDETYILHEGWLFDKVCSYRTFSCNSCDCEFLQFGRDVRRVKREDFGRRLDYFFMIFFAFLAVAGLICSVIFSIADCFLPAIVSCVVFMVSMVLGSATASK